MKELVWIMELLTLQSKPVGTQRVYRIRKWHLRVFYGNIQTCGVVFCDMCRGTFPKNKAPKTKHIFRLSPS